MSVLLKSGEDYLEAIYNLSESKKEVKSVDIANLLNVTKPSTFRALNNLATQGYIIKESYGKIYITELGREKAILITKKHSAIKRLLTEVLKVSPQIAEIDACKIEHNISEETTEKLIAFLATKQF